MMCRILNRFAKDLESIDQEVGAIMNTYFTIWLLIGITLIIIAVIFPLFAMILPVFAFLYYKLQRYYRGAALELNRLQDISRSPIYQVGWWVRGGDAPLCAGLTVAAARVCVCVCVCVCGQHFGESIEGVLTLRAFKRMPTVHALTNELMDAKHRAYLSLEITLEWLSIRIGVLGAFVVGLTCATLIAAQDDVDPGLAGFAFAYSFQVFGVFGFCVALATWLEVKMNHVDRVLEYTNVRQPPVAVAVDAGRCSWVTAVAVLLCLCCVVCCAWAAGGARTACHRARPCARCTVATAWPHRVPQLLASLPRQPAAGVERCEPHHRGGLQGNTPCATLLHVWRRQPASRHGCACSGWDRRAHRSGQVQPGVRVATLVRWGNRRDLHRWREPVHHGREACATSGRDHRPGASAVHGDGMNPTVLCLLALPQWRDAYSP